MADPTYTLAGLRIELNAVITAVEAGDYASARVGIVRARAVLTALPQVAANDGTIVKMAEAQLEEMATLVAAAESSSASSDRRRFIKTRVRHIR